MSIWREVKIIVKIRKEMQRADLLSYVRLNNIKSKTADLVMRNKIRGEFYRKVFLGGTMSKHWSEVNKEYILNYPYETSHRER